MFDLVRPGAAVALLLTSASPALAQKDASAPIEMTVDTAKPGGKIDRNIFGQFAEHLGTGIYGGVWVGKDSPIPNVRGIRKDVVAALRAIRVPNVRWPGGCFADEYHWRHGIGPAKDRRVTINSNWAARPNQTASEPTSSWTSPTRSAATPISPSISAPAPWPRRPNGSNT